MPYPDSTPPSGSRISALFQEELARLAGMPGVAAAAPVLWPRFAAYYQNVTRLPRKVRRALQRRWRRSLGSIALLCALGQAPALAATIAVGRSCTLVDAITAANTDAPVGRCSAGSGADRITLPILSTHTLTTANGCANGPTGLPVITSEITIVGSIATITRDSSAPPFRILAVDATGDLTLVDTIVTGGITASDMTCPAFLPAGGGIDNSGTVTLTDSRISSNEAVLGGGIGNRGTMTLANTTVSGNRAVAGGGIHNSGTLTLTDSRISSNTARQFLDGLGIGGGIENDNGILIVTNSTVSGNTADISGSGVGNHRPMGNVTLTNSTVSGNTASDRGGGVNNEGTVTFTNSTVSRNASGRVGGGLFNTGTVTLVQSLLSGNTAPVIAPEAYNISGTVIGNGFNLFGHNDFSGVAGFTLDATDLVPGVPLPAILDPTLSYNGGPTRTHTLVFRSPAVDAVPGPTCATDRDQRGAPRPQDADGNTVPKCDIGAVERGLIPIQAEILSPTLDCRERGCRVSVRCNLLETECRNPIDITVRRAAVRAPDGTLVKAPRRFRFAAGVTNIPPGGTQTMRLPLTRRGTRVVQTTEKKRLRGRLAIREIGAIVTNTPPPPISTTGVTLRLRRR